MKFRSGTQGKTVIASRTGAISMVSSFLLGTLTASTHADTTIPISGIGIQVGPINKRVHAVTSGRFR